ncbi:MAG: hypothetical protein KAF91_32180 [Nostoc sp. TH1S01]|nr:hypothetical protein [Nostoc sp. TH1S01]
MQALNIAKYDKAAAFRYADNYLSGIVNQTRKPKWIVIKAGSFSEMKWSCTRTARIAYCNLRN